MAKAMTGRNVDNLVNDLFLAMLCDRETILVSHISSLYTLWFMPVQADLKGPTLAFSRS